MLDPREVEDKQFTPTRMKSGYDQNEVDEFLDRVGSDYRYMFDRVSELKAENSRLRGGDTQVISQASGSTSAAMERLLQLAEEEAGKIRSQATWETNKVKADALVEAEKIKQEAHQATAAEHADIIRQAQERKAELLLDIAQLDDQIAHLNAARDRHADTLKDALRILETEE